MVKILLVRAGNKLRRGGSLAYWTILAFIAMLAQPRVVSSWSTTLWTDYSGRMETTRLHSNNPSLQREYDGDRLFDRRSLVIRLFSGAGGLGFESLFHLDVARADDVIAPTEPPSKKPFAPLEKLLPAARVKWTIDQAATIAATTEADSEGSWQQLQSLLILPQNYTSGVLSQIPAAPAKAYLDTYKRNRENLDALARPGAALVQSGEIAAWKSLKRQERREERQDEIRAALNMYTSALNYNAEAYTLNVPAAERKQMIREDRLPDIKQVIQSDMGLRYLYRNELLTAMQQVRAELEYQIFELPLEQRSREELTFLLYEAQRACNQWFSFIDEADIDRVMLAVTKERQDSSVS